MKREEKKIQHRSHSLQCASTGQLRKTHYTINIAAPSPIHSGDKRSWKRAATRAEDGYDHTETQQKRNRQTTSNYDDERETGTGKGEVRYRIRKKSSKQERTKFCPRRLRKRLNMALACSELHLRFLRPWGR